MAPPVSVIARRLGPWLGISIDNMHEQGTGPGEAEMEAAIFSLLARRRAGQTICPSEVARYLAGDGEWRHLMAPVREMASTLARQDRITVTRRGVPVDAIARGGPIRLGRAKIQRE